MPEIDYLKLGTPEADSFPAVGHTYEADLGETFSSSLNIIL
jgi:hypothetical protein